MTNTERIEAYFDDQLSTTEKESLLRDMDTDQALKAEFEFQQEVVEGIQAYRKQELIARLNTVKVASVDISTITKIIGAVGLAAIVSGGLFWYLNSDETIAPGEDKIEVVDETSTELPSAEELSNQDIADEPRAYEEPATTGEAKIEDTREKQLIESSETTTPEVNVPEMPEPDSEGIAAVDDDHDAPASLNSEAIAVTSSANVEIKLDKQYNFHYQVVKGDLTLFGDFNDSKFEVIELKTNLGIKLYLFYNKQYFELKADTEEIRSLEPVSNQSIIDELDKRRQ